MIPYWEFVLCSRVLKCSSWLVMVVLKTVESNTHRHSCCVQKSLHLLILEPSKCLTHHPLHHMSHTLSLHHSLSTTNYNHLHSSHPCPSSTHPRNSNSASTPSSPESPNPPSTQSHTLSNLPPQFAKPSDQSSIHSQLRSAAKPDLT